MPDILNGDHVRSEGRLVGLLGGGNSAIGNPIALASLTDTRPVWLRRAESAARALGGGAANQLSARGALGVQIARLIAEGRVALETRFTFAVIEGPGSVWTVARDGRRVVMDVLILSTDFQPDLSISGELRLSLNPALECTPALAPLIDRNLRSCGTVRPHGAAELSHPEPGFFIAGMKSHSHTPNFFLATGHEQVRSIVAAISGDHLVVARVELVLTQTGVCNGRGLPQTVAATGCCGGPALDCVDACCTADEAAKDDGPARCGCNESQPEQKAAVCC